MTPKELTVQAWILYKKMIDIEFSIIDLELLFGQKHKNKSKLQQLSKRAYKVDPIVQTNNTLI
jgi:hypothetical protein